MQKSVGPDELLGKVIQSNLTMAATLKISLIIIPLLCMVSDET